MATTNYNLPTITGNMTPNVVRDMNALAEATDTAIKVAVDGVDLSQIEQSIEDVQTQLTSHLAQNNAHAMSQIIGLQSALQNKADLIEGKIPIEQLDLSSIGGRLIKIADYTHSGGMLISFEDLSDFEKIFIIIYSKYSSGSASGIKIILNDVVTNVYSGQGLKFTSTVSTAQVTSDSALYVGPGNESLITLSIENNLDFKKIINSRSVAAGSGFLINGVANILPLINKVTIRSYTTNELLSGSKVIIYGVKK